MEKAVWLRKITKACKDAGTYRAEFKPVIETVCCGRISPYDHPG